MPDQISLLGNLIITVAYAAIMAAIVVPVARAGQLRTNRLATATAIIFFSCAENHRATLAAVVEHTDDAIIRRQPERDHHGVEPWRATGIRLLRRRGHRTAGPRTGQQGRSRGTSERHCPHRRRRERHVLRSPTDAQRRHTGRSLFERGPDPGPRRYSHRYLGGGPRHHRRQTNRRAATRDRGKQPSSPAHGSLGKLAGGVAHDFNNLLAIIANYTDFAAELSTGNPHVQADLAQVRTATERAVNLTGQLLTFTRGDTIQPRDVDLNAAIAEVQAMLERTIGEHITLLTTPSPQPVAVHADPGQIQQVLLNLAINARDAMPTGGTLVIEADITRLDGTETSIQPPLPADTYARLLVSDTGEGMPADIAAHVFEPFYTTKPRGQGTGLGLSTVYGIVTEAGGSINLYSEPEVGTTFRIYLPLTRATHDNEPQPASMPKPPDGNGRTVLIVEDEPALADVAARILSNGGYEVLTATSGRQALDMHIVHGCDLLLTDVVMPEMSGPQLAGLLHQRQHDLPVLYMSGYSNGLLGTTHILDPDIALIEKPFTAHNLLHKVSRVITEATQHPRQSL